MSRIPLRLRRTGWRLVPPAMHRAIAPHSILRPPALCTTTGAMLMTAMAMTAQAATRGTRPMAIPMMAIPMAATPGMSTPCRNHCGLSPSAPG